MIDKTPLSLWSIKFISINWCRWKPSLLAITASKFIALGLISVTLAGAAIGTGVLFAGYNVGAARNPEEAENLFNTSLMAFALIETFVFLAILIGAVIFFL